MNHARYYGPTLTPALRSLLKQAQDRCYPGLLDEYWAGTLEKILGQPVYQYGTAQHIAETRVAIQKRLNA